MHEDRQNRLNELAEAVADGRVLDWDAIESTARDEDERASIRRLRAIAAIGVAHSELTLSESLSDSLSVKTLLEGIEDGSTPATWGSLRILERVGRGRFGDVYRAWDPNLDREVALKLLRRRERESADREVIDEGRLMARVRHPNVVTIHGAQRIDGRTGLWMEFVHGRTLEAELAERGPFSSDEVAHAGIELCRALGAVHEAGLVHRDVKAQNVLRDQRGPILLGDFGTGHELDDDGAGPTSMAGTPAYLAPEIFDGSAATPRSDIYSLGVLLFRLATATYPVGGRTIGQIRNAHREGWRVPLLSLRSDLPASLVNAIDRAMERDPARRFESASDMEAALTGAAATTHAREGTGSPTRLLLTALILSAVLAAVTVWGLSGNNGDRRDTDAQSPLASAGDGRVFRQAGDSIMAEPGSQSPDGRRLSVVDANDPVIAENEGGVSGSGRAPSPLANAGDGRVFRQVGDSNMAGPGSPSPDGRLLSIVDANGELAVHEFASGKRTTLTGAISGDPPGHVEHSRFSRDGSRLTYVRFVSGQSSESSVPEIRQVDPNGGRSRLIWRGNDTQYNGFGLLHSAGDDDVILAVRWIPERAEFLIINGNTGHVMATRDAPRMIWFTGASLSPDGRYVAFERENEREGQLDIDIWDIATGTATTLIRDAAEDHSPVWSPDGRHLLFLSTRSGTSGLWAHRVIDGRTFGVALRLDPDIGGSPMSGLTDSGALFVRREIGTRDVHTVDIDPDSLTVIGEPKAVSDRPRSASGSSGWSPDSTHLGFFRRNGTRVVVVVHSLLDHREREFRKALMSPARKIRWESNQSVLFKAAIDGTEGLQRLNVQTGEISTLLERSFNDFEPLPQPNTILISERVKRQVVKIDVHTGQEAVVHRVSPPFSIGDMAVSSRGDRLAYSAPLGGGKGSAVYIVDLNSDAPARELFSAPQAAGGLALMAWSADDRAVFVRRNVNAKGEREQRGHLWAINVDSGKAHHTGLVLDRGFQELQRSPNGRQLSFDAGWPYSELWVLENAASLLPR